MSPSILVFSEGDKTPSEIIKNILEANGVSKDEIQVNNEQPIDTESYSLNLKTKYYVNTLNLIPLDRKLHEVEPLIKNSAEAIIIYFEAKNKELLNDLPEICNWLNDRNIELGILLTESLKDNLSDGITRAELHKVCSGSKFIFDVIELSEAHEDEDDETDHKHDYHEVLTSLKSNIWSNIECKQPAMSSSTAANQTEHDESIESQLDAFTNLLTSIQNFKVNSASLSRNQVLDEAEKLGELLWSTIMDGDDMDDEDSDEDDKEISETSAKSK